MMTAIITEDMTWLIIRDNNNGNKWYNDNHNKDDNNDHNNNSPKTAKQHQPKCQWTQW